VGKNLGMVDDEDSRLCAPPGVVGSLPVRIEPTQRPGGGSAPPAGLVSARLAAPSSFGLHTAGWGQGSGITHTAQLRCSLRPLNRPLNGVGFELWCNLLKWMRRYLWL